MRFPIIPRLPYWTLTDLHPAFYDTESNTAIKMVAKLYAKMQELIDHYNKFIDSTNNLIETFINDANANFEEFELAFRQEFDDFIAVIETKFEHQDRLIDEAIAYMKTNLGSSITNLIREMQNDGTLDQAILDAISNSMVVSVSLDENENLHITNALVDVVAYDEVNESITIAEGDFGAKEDKTNKVTEITETSTDIEYPSARAVVNFFNGEIGEALGGEY